jgi:hypothetical protein
MHFNLFLSGLGNQISDKENLKGLEEFGAVRKENPK